MNQNTPPKYGRLTFYAEEIEKEPAWAFLEDGKEGFDALQLIEDNDALAIFVENFDPHTLDQDAVKALFNGQFTEKEATLVFLRDRMAFDYARNKQDMATLPHIVALKELLPQLTAEGAVQSIDGTIVHGIPVALENPQDWLECFTQGLPAILIKAQPR